jgi:RNA polymerase sigma-70 factor (ECF subfamily)
MTLFQQPVRIFPTFHFLLLNPLPAAGILLTKIRIMMRIEPARAEVAVERENGGAAGISGVVRRAQNGDRAAFEQIYRDNVGRVHAICLRILANAARAQELTQDVFVRAWEMIGTFRGESAFSSWLYRLAVNVVLVDLRAKKRRTARVMTTDDLSLYDKDGNMTNPGHTIDLERAIAALPEQARAVFVLHEVEGYQHGEIAALMGIAEGTSKAQLHRSRRLLREALER